MRSYRFTDHPTFLDEVPDGSRNPEFLGVKFLSGGSLQGVRSRLICILVMDVSNVALVLSSSDKSLVSSGKLPSLASSSSDIASSCLIHLGTYLNVIISYHKTILVSNVIQPL